jgi:hypothetical protein
MPWHLASESDAAPVERQRNPAGNHAETAQGGDGTEELQLRREDQGVDAPAEHGHADVEQMRRRAVLTGCNQHGHSMDQLRGRARIS